ASGSLACSGKRLATEARRAITNDSYTKHSHLQGNASGRGSDAAGTHTGIPDLTGWHTLARKRRPSTRSAFHRGTPTVIRQLASRRSTTRACTPRERNPPSRESNLRAKRSRKLLLLRLLRGLLRFLRSHGLLSFLLRLRGSFLLLLGDVPTRRFGFSRLRSLGKLRGRCLCRPAHPVADLRRSRPLGHQGTGDCFSLSS